MLYGSLDDDVVRTRRASRWVWRLRPSLLKGIHEEPSSLPDAEKALDLEARRSGSTPMPRAPLARGYGGRAKAGWTPSSSAIPSRTTHPAGPLAQALSHPSRMS